MGNDANTMGKELKGMAIGAGYGAAIGSVVPGVGTAVGAGVGAIAGGLVGLFSGGPEAQQQSADLGGRSIDAYSIYQKIHAGDPSSLENGSKAAGELKKVHTDRVGEIDALNTKMDAAWQGGGATAAQAGAHPLGIWLDASAGNLGKSDMYLGNQVDCFHTVKSKVQDLPKDPPSAGFLDGINPLSDKDDEINQYNDNSKANVQAYTAYFNASNSNAQQLPQYSAWQGNTLSDGGGGNNFGGGPGGGGNFGGGGGPGGGGGSFNPANMPKFDAKPTDFSTGHTGGNDTNDPNGNIGTGIPTGTYTPPGSDSTSAQGFTPSSFDSSGFGPGGSGGFGPGGGVGSFGAGGAGGGFGGGGAGSGAVAGFGPGAFGAGAGFGPGGAGSGAAAEGLAGGAGARGGAMGAGMGTAGKAGASGMGGMGAGGAKGGKGTEDEEHQTKYLVEEDANELFGTDELTAPPVIGE
ncbi:hypothetical protein VSH64_36620 [Amycolatopsis rhabdoformis]|uniref:Glycine zipper domain-containing protein n=1 Tax=Amycolatopsis rhabdoformis TaxID=1448059 RepID=A0ABZ1I3F2_9PSEU|nr:hypothetical protein [Amycolatopsis rhabdoformis]WSE28322.1 hypothetical protein VSH64_36620 [Amycolatopsis rhabdoformis]